MSTGWKKSVTNNTRPARWPDNEPVWHEKRTMPHVIVKLWPGKSEQQKKRLAEAIARDVMSVLNYGEESVSVAMEEIEPQEWAESVYRADILGHPEKLYKKPGIHDVSPHDRSVFPRWSNETPSTAGWKRPGRSPKE